VIDANTQAAANGAVAEAGAFALVIEGVAESLARELTAAVAVPTIEIGGSPPCDGQTMVVDDMLGLFTEFTPKFVKRYRRLGDEIRAAAREYAEEVRQAASQPPSTPMRRRARKGCRDLVGEADPRDGGSPNASVLAR